MNGDDGDPENGDDGDPENGEDRETPSDSDTPEEADETGWISEQLQHLHRHLLTEPIPKRLLDIIRRKKDGNGEDR